MNQVLRDVEGILKSSRDLKRSLGVGAAGRCVGLHSASAHGWQQRYSCRLCALHMEIQD